MTNTLSNKIEDEINKRFAKIKEYYTPIDPGRHEYRKCGIKKEGRLNLSIEEVLFDIVPLFDSSEEISEYAARKGYRHFRTYFGIRKLGWILITHKGVEESKVLSTYIEYAYKMYCPDKHFNRHTAEMIAYLIIVSPLAQFNSEIFEYTDGKPIVFAISDSDSFVLLKAKPFKNASSLLSEYTPSKRS